MSQVRRLTDVYEEVGYRIEQSGSRENDPHRAWAIGRQARSCEAKRNSIGLADVGVGQDWTPI
jgi:hypothetical protein